MHWQYSSCLSMFVFLPDPALHRDCPLDCKVYVGNLGNNGNKNELERAFGYYGPLRSVWVARNPPGFAFVEFEDPRDASDAVRELDGRWIFQHVSIIVNFCSALFDLVCFSLFNVISCSETCVAAECVLSYPLGKSAQGAVFLLHLGIDAPVKISGDAVLLLDAGMHLFTHFPQMFFFFFFMFHSQSPLLKFTSEQKRF